VVRGLAISAALLLTACGSAISLGGPGDGGGGVGGEGGAGVGGTGAAGGDPCPTVQACNPPECPDGIPAPFEPCPEQGLTCQYDESDCELTFICEYAPECSEPQPGGEPCPETAWLPGPAYCEPGVVECEVAAEGQPCAYPGETCGVGFDCEWQETTCGPDYLWHVESYSDECCGAPVVCPPLPPLDGEPCDPCFDGPLCSYEIDTLCGPALIDAYCDEPDFTWNVELPPPCP